MCQCHHVVSGRITVVSTVLYSMILCFSLLLYGTWYGTVPYLVKGDYRYFQSIKNSFCNNITFYVLHSITVHFFSSAIFDAEHFSTDIFYYLYDVICNMIQYNNRVYKSMISEYRYVLYGPAPYCMFYSYFMKICLTYRYGTVRKYIFKKSVF